MLYLNTCYLKQQKLSVHGHRKVLLWTWSHITLPTGVPTPTYALSLLNAPMIFVFPAFLEYFTWQWSITMSIDWALLLNITCIVLFYPLVLYRKSASPASHLYFSTSWAWSFFHYFVSRVWNKEGGKSEKGHQYSIEWERASMEHPWEREEVWEREEKEHPWED